MRLYDAALVAEIRRKQYTENVDGLDILFKPVPDAKREHTLDPRLEKIIAQKRSMFAQRAKGGFRLSNERWRPDKVTYDITSQEILCDERLIGIDGDHMIDVYICRTAEERKDRPVLVYLHGGGFTAGDMRLFANQMKFIAEQSGAVVIFPEYRLAPECPYPGPIRDAWGTICWAREHAAEYGGDPVRLMVAGDSAGASLTNACTLLDTEGSIRKIFTIYGAYDTSDYHTQTAYTWSYDAYDIVEDQKDLAYSRIDRIKNGIDNDPDSTNSLYLQGKATPRDPMVSLIYAPDEQLARFPEAVIVSAEYDYLRIGIEYAAKKLQGLGVKVHAIRYCGCDHGFLDMIGTIVQAEELCLTIADELKAM